MTAEKLKWGRGELRIRVLEQDSWDRTAGTGRPGQDSRDKELGQDSRDWRAREDNRDTEVLSEQERGLPKHDSKDRTTGTEKLGRKAETGRLDRSSLTGQPEQDRKDRSARTKVGRPLFWSVVRCPADYRNASGPADWKK
jgi:hypothetical protein